MLRSPPTPIRCPRSAKLLTRRWRPAPTAWDQPASASSRWMWRRGPSAGSSILIASVGPGAAVRERRRQCYSLRRRSGLPPRVRASAQAAAPRCIDRVKHAITDALGGKGTVRVAMFQVNRMSQSQQYGYQQPSQSPLRQGFRAHDTVKVETKNLGLLGAIITAGMGAGADSLDFVQFTLSDDSPASKEAIDSATRTPRPKPQSSQRRWA